jgi:hypothetical protein
MPEETPEEEFPIKLTEEDRRKMEQGFQDFFEALLNPSRIENVRISMELSKSGFLEHLETIKLLRPDAVDLHMDDDTTLSLDYDFSISYLSSVAEHLKAVQTLCEAEDVVVKASCEELEQGRILIYEVLKRLDAIIKAKKG